MRTLSIFALGTHRGVLIGTLIEEEPSYVRWAIDNTDLRLDEAALKYLEEQD